MYVYTLVRLDTDGKEGCVYQSNNAVLGFIRIQSLVSAYQPNPGNRGSPHRTTNPNRSRMNRHPIHNLPVVE